VSTTTIACALCGKLDYPHVCVSSPTIPDAPVIATEQQGRVTWDISLWFTWLAEVERAAKEHTSQ
jgi:hypothetical protein